MYQIFSFQKTNFNSSNLIYANHFCFFLFRLKLWKFRVFIKTTTTTKMIRKLETFPNWISIVKIVNLFSARQIEELWIERERVKFRSVKDGAVNRGSMQKQLIFYIVSTRINIKERNLDTRITYGEINRFAGSYSWTRYWSMGSISMNIFHGADLIMHLRYTFYLYNIEVD